MQNPITWFTVFLELGRGREGGGAGTGKNSCAQVKR